MWREYRCLLEAATAKNRNPAHEYYDKHIFILFPLKIMMLGSGKIIPEYLIELVVCRASFYSQ